MGVDYGFVTCNKGHHTRRDEMTKSEATSIIAEMKEKTPLKAQKALIKLALSRGKLGPDARKVYSDRLGEL